MTGEHVHSDWMNKLIPGKWERTFFSSFGRNFQHSTKHLNWKLPVVCDKCNSGWMSDIENKHAKPVMGPLMTGNINIPIDLKEAKSIALFAFKTALVVDMLSEESGVQKPFYSQRIRTAFKNGHNIPGNVNMWLCAYASRNLRADVLCNIYQGNMAFTGHLKLHCITFSAGSFAFQVLGAKTLSSNLQLAPHRNFDRLSVPFWPSIPRGFIWPPKAALMNVEDFIAYHRRWESCIEIVSR